jgi:hypothetical protein
VTSAGKATKRDFLAALRKHLEDKRKLPKECPSCSATLVYFDAQFRLYEDTEHFTIPLGFCPYCDELPPAREAAVA